MKFGDIGTLIGGVSGAVTIAYLVAGSLRKRRLEREAGKATDVEKIEADKLWRQRVHRAIWGLDPTQYGYGYRGLISRADRTEDQVFGNHNNALEPTGKPDGTK